MHAIFKKKTGVPLLSSCFLPKCNDVATSQSIDYKRCSSKTITYIPKEITGEIRTDSDGGGEKTTTNQAFKLIPAVNVTARVDCSSAQIQWKPPPRMKRNELLAIRVDCKPTESQSALFVKDENQIYLELTADQVSCELRDLANKKTYRIDVIYLTSHECNRDANCKVCKSSDEFSHFYVTTLGVDPASNLKWNMRPDDNTVSIRWKQAKAHGEANEVKSQVLYCQELSKELTAFGNIQELTLPTDAKRHRVSDLKPGHSYKVWVETKTLCEPVSSEPLYFIFPALAQELFMSTEKNSRNDSSSESEASNRCQEDEKGGERKRRPKKNVTSSSAQCDMQIPKEPIVRVTEAKSVKPKESDSTQTTVQETNCDCDPTRPRSRPPKRTPKTKVLIRYKERIIYRDRIVEKRVPEIVEKPTIVYQDRVEEKIVEKIVPQIVYMDRPVDIVVDRYIPQIEYRDVERIEEKYVPQEVIKYLPKIQVEYIDREVTVEKLVYFASKPEKPKWRAPCAPSVYNYNLRVASAECPPQECPKQTSPVCVNEAKCVPCVPVCAPAPPKTRVRCIPRESCTLPATATQQPKPRAASLPCAARAKSAFEVEVAVKECTVTTYQPSETTCNLPVSARSVSSGKFNSFAKSLSVIECKASIGSGGLCATQKMFDCKKMNSI